MTILSVFSLLFSWFFHDHGRSARTTFITGLLERPFDSPQATAGDGRAAKLEKPGSLATATNRHVGGYLYLLLCKNDSHIQRRRLYCTIL